MHRIKLGLVAGALLFPCLIEAVEPPEATTVNAADLVAYGVHTIADLAAATPSLSFAPSFNSATTPLLFMQGIGQTAPGQITRDGGVALFQDGFYIARAQASTFDLLDVDHIQVLAGPQGAAYGRNTSGGVIAVTTAQPSGVFDFKQYLEFGNRNSFRALSTLDTPTWHEVSVKLTGLASGIDGYVKNLASTSLDYGLEHQRAGRIQVSWGALPTLRVDYFAELARLDSTADYDTNPSLNGQLLLFPYTYFANASGPMTKTYRPVALPLSTSRHLAQGLTLAWRPSSTFTLKSLTGYRTLDQTAWQDPAESQGFAELSADLYEHHQLTEQLLLDATLLGGQLHLEAGGEYFRERGFHTALLDLPDSAIVFRNAIVADARSESGHVRIELAPEWARGLSITVAGRYTQDRKQAQRFYSDSFAVFESGAASGAVNDLSYTHIDPDLTVSYAFGDALTLFAEAGSSYRAGGALETAPIGQFATGFRPEVLDTAQLGVRSRLLGDRLHIEAAAFDSRVKDVQAPLPINAITDQLFTLQRASIRGAHLEVAGTPVADLKLSVSLAYLNWTIDRADVTAGTALDPASGSGSAYGVGENVRQLFALPFAPKYAGSVAADYTVRRLSFGELDLHVDYDYRGSLFADWAAGSAVPGRSFDAIPAYGLLNARASIIHDTDFNHQIRIGLYGRNVLDRRYYAVAQGFGGGIGAFNMSGAAAGDPLGYTARVGAWAPPATYGLDITYRY